MVRTQVSLCGLMLAAIFFYPLTSHAEAPRHDETKADESKLADDPFGNLDAAISKKLKHEKSLIAEDSTPPATANPRRFRETAATEGVVCRCVGDSDEAAVARIESVLRERLRPNGLDFTDTPLEEVVNLLQEEYGIPIQIENTALKKAGLDPEESVTVNIHNVSLKAALKLMLEQHGLVYVVRDEVLHITTPEAAESDLRTCVYDVRPVLSDTSAKGMEEVIDTIVSCISTKTWSENGGGDAEIRPLKPGLLVVSQSPHVHDQIKELLRSIQVMRGWE